MNRFDEALKNEDEMEQGAKSLAEFHNAALKLGSEIADRGSNGGVVTETENAFLLKLALFSLRALTRREM